MQHPMYLFTFLLSSALKWGQINFGIQNERIFKPYDACFLCRANVFCCAQDCIKTNVTGQYWRKFYQHLKQNNFHQNRYSGKSAALRSVGVRSTNRWSDKYLALSDWQRFLYLSFLQQCAQTDNNPSSIVTHIIHLHVDAFT